MKKKVAIITLDGLYNYGNRLQNLAVQYLYEKEGCDCRTLIIKRSRLRAFYRLGRSFLKNPIKTFRFAAFNRKYIHIRKLYSKEEKKLQKVVPEFDLFSVGSDQVWNPYVRPKDKHIFYLQFVDRKKRIALAPSIAVERIPEEHLSSFVQGVSGFDQLSVRESKGAELIRMHICRDAKVLVDPTLALSAVEWEQLLRLPEKKNTEEYILLYFLGEISGDRMRLLQSFADCHRLRIVSAYIKNGMNMRNTFDPVDFVNLVRNARYVFTDSFHGVAFSVVFNRSFYAFRRWEAGITKDLSMESRLLSILEKMALDNRFCDGFPVKIEDIDYSETNTRLQTERERFAQFVHEVLQDDSV